MPSEGENLFIHSEPMRVTIEAFLRKIGFDSQRPSWSSLTLHYSRSSMRHEAMEAVHNVILSHPATDFTVAVERRGLMEQNY